MGAAADFFGQDFGAQAGKVVSKVKEVASDAASFFGVDFGAVMAPRTPQKQPTIDDQGDGGTLTLDSVYKRLLGAESNDTHRDKSGKLITSPVGALGVSQVMPKTGVDPGYGIKPLQNESKDEYLRFGKDYLKAMYDKFGDWEQALAGYNAGPGNVDKAIARAKEKGGDWKDYLPKPKETLPYIEKILGKKKEHISALNTPPNKIQKGQSVGQMVENVKQTAYDIASILPGTGEVISLAEAYKGFKEGDKIATALGLAGAIPLVPGMLKPKPYFHGTRKIFDKHEDGLIFLSDTPEVAGSYASGAGGQRGSAKAAFYKDAETDVIYEQQGDELVQVTGKGKGKRLPADVEELESLGIYPTEDWDKVAQDANIRRYYVDTEKTLNLRHKGYDRGGKAINEGAAVLASIDPKGNRWAVEIVRKAKSGEFDWSTTKYPEAQKAWKEVIIPQLKEKGYDSIQYWDDMHETLAVFDNKSLKSTLPKKLATADKKAQQESITNLINFLENNGKFEEAKKLREINKIKDVPVDKLTPSPLDTRLQESVKPLTYYHGTTANFKEFDLSKGRGMAFFTPDESFAKVYSKEDGRVIKANLSIKNPASYEEYKKVRKEVGTSSVAEALKKKGYDGVVDESNPPLVIVFDKSQIKMLED